MKRNLFLFLLSIITILYSTFIVPAAPSINLSLHSPNTICSTGNDTLSYGISASNIPANTNIVVYQSTDSAFNPAMGQGDSIGFIPGNSIPQDTVNFGSCIKTLGIFIDACGASGQEGSNEYMVLTSGNGIRVSNLAIDFSSQNNNGPTNADINTGASPCQYQTPSSTLVANLQLGSCNASNVIAASPGDSIPANAIILLFTSDAVSANYGISGLCNLGYPIYVLQSACARTVGAFTNAPRCDAPSRYRTTVAIDKRQNCRDNFTYDLCGIFDEDGTFAVRQQGTDTASVANNGIRRNAIDSCGGIDYSQLDFSTDTILKLPLSQIQCNNGNYYIKAILNPNTFPVTVSNTIQYKYVCNDVTATSLTQNICSGDSALVNITSTDPNANFSWTVSGGVNITGAIAGTANSIRQQLINVGTTTDSITYNIISNDAGCIKTTSVKVVVNKCDTCNTVVTISGDNTLCMNTSTILTAIGQFDSVRWSTGAVSTSITVTEQGTYTVTAYSNGCAGIATFDVVRISASYFLNKRSDTICSDGIAMFILFTGDRSASPVDTFTFTQAGIYQINYNTQTCGIFIDSVVVTQIICVPDTVYVCQGSSLILDAPDGYTRYEWSPNINMNDSTLQHPTVMPIADIKYNVKAYKDSINGVNLVFNGDFELGKMGFSTDMLNIPFFTNPPNSVYNIDTVSNVRDTTHQWCNSLPDHTLNGKNMMIIDGPSISNSNEIIWQQTVNVMPNKNYIFELFGLNNHPQIPPVFDIYVNDIKIVDAQSYNNSCVWNRLFSNWSSSDTTTAAAIKILDRTGVNVGNDFILDDIGLYAVDSILYEDSVYIVVNPLPVVTITGDTTFCAGSQTTLAVSPGQFDMVLWSTGAQTSSILIIDAGMYSVRVTDTNNCSNSDTINIASLSCIDEIWVPNAFTPNGDGINDIFLVRGNPENTIVEKFIIYNRWGNKVYEATNILPDDITTGWDGKYKGEFAQNEVYSYYVIARFKDDSKKTLKGSVTLLR